MPDTVEERSENTRPAVPRVLRAWYVICTSAELKAGAKPLARSLYGTPIAVWRSVSGTPSAMLDRCPHRGVPLTFGTVCGEHLQCGYHGWTFDGAGRCQRVPTLIGESDKQGRQATVYPLREQQGFVWIWADTKTEPDCDPYTFPYADKPGYLTVRHQVRANGSVHAVAENALDVPHTAFLHGGLFRKDTANPNRIKCVLERTDAGVACEYIGEPRPEGLVAWLLAPSGGIVTHFDRFHMPCITEVEYALGEDSHFVNAAALTPADDYDTILYAVAAIRTRIPSFLIKPVVLPFAMRIFAQDRVVLELQTASAQRFAGSRYASTEVDLIGPHILRLLNRAASGAADPAEPYRTEIEIDV